MIRKKLAEYAIIKEKNAAVVETYPYAKALAWAMALFCISITFNYYSGMFADKMVSGYVEDIFLSNVPLVDTSLFFVYGPVLFWSFICIVSLYHARRIPFLLKTISLFVVVRAIFVCLTHLGPYPTQALFEGQNIISQFSMSNDFFFSGHTGLPYLMAYVFWDVKIVRYICIFSAVFFGFVVLLGHFHYTIDVVGAFFITASIYRIAEKFFAKDLLL